MIDVLKAAQIKHKLSAESVNKMNTDQLLSCDLTDAKTNADIHEQKSNKIYFTLNNFPCALNLNWICCILFDLILFY